MDHSLFLPVLFGALGGFVRALVGVAKYFEKNKKDQKFRLGYVLYTIFLAKTGTATVITQCDIINTCHA